MKSTLLILTTPMRSAPRQFLWKMLKQATEVAFVGDGVYSLPTDARETDTTLGMPGGHRAVTGMEDAAAWPDNWLALEEDAAARRVDFRARLVDARGLLEAIERNERVVTI